MGLTESWSQADQYSRAVYVSQSRAAGVRHTPTLVVFARGARLEDLAGLRAEPSARLLPSHDRELLWDPARNPRVRVLSPHSHPGAARRPAAMAQTLRELREAGVPILAGTDTPNPFVVPGASLHEELALLAEAGLGIEGAWAAASREAGAALGRAGLGKLAEDTPADLLVFGKNPLLDLAALDSLEAVVADGRLYRIDALRDALAHHLAHAERGLPRTLSRLLARIALAAAKRLARASLAALWRGACPR